MRSFVSYWVLLLFVLSGALPANVIPVQSRAEFAAEQEPGSLYREDESTRSSASRKLGHRGRKSRPFLSRDLASTPPSVLMTPPSAGPRHSASSESSHPHLHRLYEVFRI